jgi:hypothetical protein
MQKNVSPVLAIVIILVCLAVIAFAWMKFSAQPPQPALRQAPGGGKKPAATQGGKGGGERRGQATRTARRGRRGGRGAESKAGGKPGGEAEKAPAGAPSGQQSPVGGAKRGR